MTGIGVRIRVRSVSEFRSFFTSLGFALLSEDTFLLGDSALLLEEDPLVATDLTLWGRGWRYLTFQIRDVRQEHFRFLEAGGKPGMPITQLRDVVRAAMVRDPDGNWIELSQRASLVGA